MIRRHELPTVLAALKWWQGRKGKLPAHLESCFDEMPALSADELSLLIRQLEHELHGNPVNDAEEETEYGPLV